MPSNHLARYIVGSNDPNLRHLAAHGHQSPGCVQKRPGHSSFSITMDNSCHWVPGEGREDLDAVLGGGLGGVALVPNPGENSPIIPYKKEISQ